MALLFPKQLFMHHIQSNKLTTMAVARLLLLLLVYLFHSVAPDSINQCDPNVYNLQNVTYPDGYEKSLSLSATHYCSDRKEGNTACNSKWIWGASGNDWQCLWWGAFQNPCDCTSFSCNGFQARSGACKCAMSFDSDTDYCFTSTKQCTKQCSPGQYLTECGCKLVSTNTNSAKQWVCSEGTCKVLPDNYYSLGPKYQHPIKCPNGANRAANNITCEFCWDWYSNLCKEKQFLDNKYTLSNCCGASNKPDYQKCPLLPLNKQTIDAHPELCIACDECTPYHEIKGSMENHCVQPNKFYSNLVQGGQCTECTTCGIQARSKRGMQALSNSLLITTFSDPQVYHSSNWLPVTKAAEACVYAYDSSLGGLGNSNAMRASKYPSPAGDVEYMPFVLGYQRRPGEYGAFSNVNQGNGLIFTSDILASYRTCSTSTGQANENMMVLPINNVERFTTYANQLYMDLFQPWGQDCEPMLQTRCQAGYSAEVNNVTWPFNDMHLTYLLKCNKCPSNSNTSMPGFFASCDCSRGYAHIDVFRQVLSTPDMSISNCVPKLSVDLSVDITNDFCFECSTSVEMHCPNKSPYKLPISCNADEPAHVCKEGTFLRHLNEAAGVKTACEPCAPGTYLQFGMTSCTPCAPGQYSDASGSTSCIDCPDGQYSSSPGQTSCSTYKRVQDCPEGQTELVFSHVKSADHECRSCTKCSGEHEIMVVADGQGISNPCWNGRPYFACLDDRQLYSGLAANQRMRYALTNANDEYVNGYDAIQIVKCDDTLLPAHAAWIEYRPPQHVAKQCYFSCQYGLGGSADSLHTAISDSMPGEYDRDLYLVSHSSAPRLAVNTKVRLPRRWAGGFTQTSQPKTWADISSSTAVVTGSTSGDVSDEYSRRNIFFFNETVMSKFQNKNDVCLPPSSISQSCQSSWLEGGDLGLWTPLDNVAGQPCAWLAASNGIAQVCLFRNSEGVCNNYGYAVLMDDPLNNRVNIAACTASVSTLSSTTATTNQVVVQGWYYGCYSNRVDSIQQLVANGLMDPNIPDLLNSERLQNLLYWLQPKSWSLQMKNGDIWNPYTATHEGLQCISSQKYASFLVSLSHTQLANTKYGAAAACVPCGDLNLQAQNEALCDLFMSTSVDKYHFMGCSSSLTSIITMDQVCKNCQQFDYAELITKASAPALYDKWLLSLPSTSNSANDWTCRYKCNTNYYRNTQAASYTSYKVQPCLACPTASVSMCGPGEYFDSSMVMCPLDGISAFQRPCQSCSVLNLTLLGQLILPASPTAVATKGACLGFCDPALYHTIVSGMGYVSGAVQQASILACEPCTANLNIPCHGACPTGRYLNAINMSCPICNTSACPLGQYRTDCPSNATQDTLCNACNDAWLFNSAGLLKSLQPADNQTQNLMESLQQTQGLAVKRWIINHNYYDNLTEVQLMQQFSIIRVPKPDALAPNLGCYLTCRNNLVWIDVSTGMHPLVNVQKTSTGQLLNKAFFACIPCSSPYISMFYSGSLPLYSVWNTSSSVAIPTKGMATNPLSLMAQFNGTCSPCADVWHDVTDDSDIFCNVKPGSGTLNPGSPLIIYPLMQPSVNNQFQGASSESYTTVQTLSKANGPEPILNSSEFAFFCCGDLHFNTELQHICYQMKSQRAYNSFLKDVRKGTLDFNASLCNTSTTFNISKWAGYNIALLPNRRLLQASPTPIVMGCLNGEFKTKRGAGVCAQCPTGASTVSPWNGISTYDACACLPGYRAVRDASTNRLLSCQPCALNTYSNYPTTDDRVCTPCPNGTEAQTIASTYCMCPDGTYRSADMTSCLPCSKGSYCQMERMFKCPDYSSTPTDIVGRSRGDCVCKAGFYGLLSDWSQVCQPLPIGASCPPQSGMIPGECQCSSGWDSDWRLENTQMVLHCVPHIAQCGAGHYINISHANYAISQETCVKCPVNTYSAGQASMYDPSRPYSQQCTPCPFNFYTTGTGATSISDCICSKHVLHIYTNKSSSAASSLVCGGCPSDTVYNVFTQQCSSCPNGMLPIDSSVCGCAAGSQVSISGNSCEPCPLNYYSREVSISCTPCANNRITKATGSTNCLCSNGLLPRAGIC